MSRIVHVLATVGALAGAAEPDDALLHSVRPRFCWLNNQRPACRIVEAKLAAAEEKVTACIAGPVESDPSPCGAPPPKQLDTMKTIVEPGISPRLVAALESHAERSDALVELANSLVATDAAKAQFATAASSLTDASRLLVSVVASELRAEAQASAAAATEARLQAEGAAMAAAAVAREACGSLPYDRLMNDTHTAAIGAGYEAAHAARVAARAASQTAADLASFAFDTAAAHVGDEWSAVCSSAAALVNASSAFHAAAHALLEPSQLSELRAGGAAFSYSALLSAVQADAASASRAAAPVMALASAHWASAREPCISAALHLVRDALLALAVLYLVWSLSLCNRAAFAEHMAASAAPAAPATQEADVVGALAAIRDAIPPNLADAVARIEARLDEMYVEAGNGEAGDDAAANGKP